MRYLLTTNVALLQTLPLGTACQGGHVETVRLLLVKNAQSKRKDKVYVLRCIHYFSSGRNSNGLKWRRQIFSYCSDDLLPSPSTGR